MPNRTAPLVGAPKLDAVAPLKGTPYARFDQWLWTRKDRVEGMLQRLTDRWQPLGAFVEVNFMHPVFGPAGSLALATSTIDAGPLHHRLDRLHVIPFTDLEPYVPRWRRGETVLVNVADMPPRLARRYATTPIVWSLNVPVAIEGEWVGVVGAVESADGFDPRAVEGFEAMAKVVTADFAADEAWTSFHTERGKRFLRLLP